MVENLTKNTKLSVTFNSFKKSGLLVFGLQIHLEVLKKLFF